MQINIEDYGSSWEFSCPNCRKIRHKKIKQFKKVGIKQLKLKCFKCGFTMIQKIYIIPSIDEEKQNE